MDNSEGILKFWYCNFGSTTKQESDYDNFKKILYRFTESKSVLHKSKILSKFVLFKILQPSLFYKVLGFYKYSKPQTEILNICMEFQREFPLV